MKTLNDIQNLANNLLDDMKKRQIVIRLFLILALATILYLALSLFSKWIGSLNPNVSAAIITATIGLIGLWYAQWHTRTREISESHRQSKIDVYNTFFDIVEKFQEEHGNASFKTKDDIPEPLRKDLQRLNRGLIIWGSPAVIKAWLHFRVLAGQGNPKILTAVDSMYQAIRKDLGNSNFGLQSGDLVKSMLSDPENWGN